MSQRRGRPRQRQNRSLGPRQEDRVETIVKRQLNKRIEWHHFDYSSNVSPSYSGSIVSVSSVTQGDGDSQRSGDNIYATSLQCRYFVYNGDDNNMVRVVAIQYFGDDTPVVGDVFGSTGTVSSVLDNYVNDKVGKKKLIRVLYDRLTTVNAPFSGGLTYRAHSFKVRLKRRQIQYQAGGTSGTGKIYLLFISDSAAVVHPTVYYKTRLWFQDA